MEHSFNHWAGRSSTSLAGSIIQIAPGPNTNEQGCWLIQASILLEESPQIGRLKNETALLCFGIGQVIATYNPQTNEARESQLWSTTEPSLSERG